MKRRNMMTRFTGNPGTPFSYFERQSGEYDEVEMLVTAGRIVFTVPNDVPDSALFEHMRHLQGELILDNGMRAQFSIQDVQNDILLDVLDAVGVTRRRAEPPGEPLAAD